MYQGTYELIGGEHSMFSRKLEAQLRFQDIPWKWRFKTQQRTAEVEARVGTHFIPALATPDNWIIHDTIALGPFLNDRFKLAPVIPSTPMQRGLCFILEDIFNHWLGRVAVHTRWCYPENVAWVGPRFGANALLDRSVDVPFTEQELEELAPIGEMMLEQFGRPVCENTGVPPDKGEAVRADYDDMLAILATHFQGNDFLLGGRPCLADFALGGACKAHFVNDPIPREWLGEHRDMLFAYTDRVFGAESASCAWPGDDVLPEHLDNLLDYADRTYYQFAPASIRAGLQGEKYYEYDYGYGPTRARSQKRLEKARQHVRCELLGLGDGLELLKKRLDGHAALPFYLPESLV
ncbi:MAG: glutathione S-transferase family protein [Halieaceae bacterium]|jgi:glutathione S-transferase|nr:glutathione S-transferase family protein [Halieaceae bacterium]